MSSLKIEPDQSQNAATTLDDFLGGRIKIAQPKQGHRAGSDAVWLQAAVAAQSGDKVLDAGAGVGVAGLCLLARCPQIHVTAVDIDEGAVALAEANAQLNANAAHFRAITLDLTAPSETLIAKGLVREGYDQVMANPPFHVEGTVRPAPDAGRAAAHIMEAGALESWVRFLATFTAPKGRITLIHMPQDASSAPAAARPPLRRRHPLPAVPEGGRACGPRHRPGAEGKPRRHAPASWPRAARGRRTLHGKGRGGAAPRTSD